MTILITGGTGFIGSHTVVALIEQGFDLIVFDNLSNSKINVLNQIQEITGKNIHFIFGDIRDAELLDKVFSKHTIESVIHFAGLKAVSESLKKPLEYYDNNVAGTLQLLKAMQKYAVKQLVFSSSATVYGACSSIPYNESTPIHAINPYGYTKCIIESILSDLHRAEPDWAIANLRYFNPAGAHHSGLLGEDPNGIPNNLFPYLTQVAAGIRKTLSIFGNDYPTKDGTGIRDYIHVMDLAEGHIAALDYLKTHREYLTVNLGRGLGTSVLEIINTFSKVTGQNIPYETTARRPGDLAAYWADPSLAKQMLGWHAKRNIEAICLDAWKWQQTICATQK